MPPKVSLPPTLIRKHHDGRIETYNIHNILGQGGFGTVFRVTKGEYKEEFALKVTPLEALKKPKLMQKHRSEVEIQRRLDHPNILKSYDYFEDSKNTYIVLELCPNQSIKELVRKKGSLSENETASILRGVISGVVYLHDNRIIHRDLKLENFLIGKDGKIKIADFGLSTKLDFDDQRRFTVCGTPNYLSPEILNSSNKGHSYEVDIWAIGVCAFAMLTGKPPFETRNIKLTYEHIRSCSYHFPPDLKLSFVAKDFVQSILQINPELRPSAGELSLHPFLALADKKLTHRTTSEQRRKFETVFPHESKESNSDKKSDNTNNGHNKNQIQTQFQQNKKEKPKGDYMPELEEMHIPLHRLDTNCQNENIIHEFNKQINTLVAPDYCVSRFCDLSDKFGIGYLLLNGSVGVCFIDSSRMILEPNEKFIQYWSSYQTTFPAIFDKDDSVQKKKIAILLKFSETLKKAKSMYKIPNKPFNPNTPMHHVKYWMRSEEALLFRFDDRTIQVNFFDKMKLIIFWSTKEIMLVNSIQSPGTAHLIRDLHKDPSIDEEKRRFSIAKAMLEEMNG